MTIESWQAPSLVETAANRVIHHGTEAFVPGHDGHLRFPLGRLLAAAGPNRVYQQWPVGPVPYELAIEPAALDHHVRDSERDCAVVPGRGLSQRSALLASPASRGSTTMSRAPRFCAAIAVVAWEIRALLGL